MGVYAPLPLCKLIMPENPPSASGPWRNNSLGRGLVDDPLSLSYEMRPRGEVPRSAALSDKFCEAAVRVADVCAKRASGVKEGASWTSVLLPLLLLTRAPRAERAAGEERRREGRAVSLSELVCSELEGSEAVWGQRHKAAREQGDIGTNKTAFHQGFQLAPTRRGGWRRPRRRRCAPVLQRAEREVEAGIKAAMSLLGECPSRPCRFIGRLGKEKVERKSHASALLLRETRTGCHICAATAESLLAATSTEVCRAGVDTAKPAWDGDEHTQSSQPNHQVTIFQSQDTFHLVVRW